MSRPALALVALLALGCSADPARAGDLPTGLLCGWVESENSPITSDWPVPAMLTILAPSGALLTPLWADACDVSAVGSTCLVVAPGEQWRAWTSPMQSGSRVEWIVQSIPPGGACP